MSGDVGLIERAKQLGSKRQLTLEGVVSSQATLVRCAIALEALQARIQALTGERDRAAEDAKAECLAHIDYIRENIRFQQGKRKRFDIYDLDRALRNTCHLIKERITGEDAGKWIQPPDAQPKDTHHGR